MKILKIHCIIPKGCALVPKVSTVVSKDSTVVSKVSGLVSKVSISCRGGRTPLNKCQMLAKLICSFLQLSSEIDFKNYA